MDKILNPWRNVEGYLCFGCSPDNQSGLKMEFYEDGDEIARNFKAGSTLSTGEYRPYCWMKYAHGW